MHRDASTKSIHQPLWKEESFTIEEAFFYSNKLILEEIEAHSKDNPLTIIDLGCGVGSSIFYLLEQFGKSATYYGINISTTQIAIANQRAKNFLYASSPLSEVHFIEADFAALPKRIPNIDIAFSIEAFVHASEAHKYVEQVSRKLNKGGKIILIDDFLNDAINLDNLDKKAQQAIADFKYGWLANSLKTQAELCNIAATYSLKIISELDLTPIMRNNTLKHKWIRFLVTSFRWLYELSPWKSYYFRSWIGGNAKQYCLKEGIVKYKKIVLEKI